MPFEIINSAATLKRAMKKLIEDLDDVDFYWDDILVHIRSWEEQIRPTKCLLGVNSVDFLGHRLEQGMIGLHQDNVEKIKDVPRPSTKKQVRSFMGLAGYYRDFSFPTLQRSQRPCLISHGKANPIKLSGVKHKKKPTKKSSVT